MSTIEELKVLRRIAERGFRKAQLEQSDYLDLFQHLLDEIGRVTDKLRCPICDSVVGREGLEPSTE